MSAQRMAPCVVMVRERVVNGASVNGFYDLVDVRTVS